MEKIEKVIRTRFAPSPTGFIHLGALRTALYTYCLAKKSNGVFILRIEDTDRDRYVEGATDAIYKSLRVCGLNWDEGPDIGGDYGPYVQSERMDLYKKYAMKLIENDGAYYCFCDNKEHQDGKFIKPSDKCPCRSLSSEKLKEKFSDNLNSVIRQKVPIDGSTDFYDEIYGDVTFPNSELDDQILLKSDGMPTYNFANVIDDYLMKITHVVRGNEYLSSTPKYNLLYKAFGWDPPVYIHVEQIMRDKTHKLSKRDGDAYFEDFINKGYLVTAIINYIALLGWSPKTENEIFLLDELINEFDIGSISKSPAVFDEVKMRAINGEHIRLLSPEKFKEIALPYIKKSCGHKNINFDVLSETLQRRTEVLSDIPNQIDFINELPNYNIDLYVNKKMKTTLVSAFNALENILPVLENIENFTRQEIHDSLFKLIEKLGIKNGQVLYPLRVAVSGKETTPGGGVELCAVLGKTETIDRIKKSLELIKKAVIERELIK